ncbi:c-type cytochrome [Sinorhizobium medicae]|uniref:c-type cytochrome n=1 Tax=Sinorhizobium medicae TaxID=110321 RepID=UPI001F406480|nr:c-type cytochrome [Sinorhizobium medicae]
MRNHVLDRHPRSASLFQYSLGSGACRPDGERLFRSRCGSCHGLNTGENRVGPHLFGVFGRAAGSVAGARYSNALRTSGFVWDEERLHAYLNNPRQVVPGTTMSASVRDQAQRSAIITYLQSLSAEPPN